MVKHLASIMHEPLDSIPSSTKKKKKGKKALREEALLDSIRPESSVPWRAAVCFPFPALHPILHIAWFYLVLHSSIVWLYVPFTFLFYFDLNEKTKMNSARVTLNQNSTPYALSVSSHDCRAE